MNWAEWLPRAIGLTYVWMLAGAGMLFRPVDKTGRGRLLVLSFFPMLYATARLAFWPALAVPAAISLAVGFGLFNWAAWSIRGMFFSYVGSTDTPAFVFQGGPFAYVRNPFYTSYLLAHVATTLVFPHWVSALALVLAAYSANDAAVFEEQKFAQSPRAEEYRAYASRAGRFIPWVK